MPAQITRRTLWRKRARPRERQLESGHTERLTECCRDPVVQVCLDPADESNREMQMSRLYPRDTGVRGGLCSPAFQLVDDTRCGRPWTSAPISMAANSLTSCELPTIQPPTPKEPTSNSQPAPYLLTYFSTLNFALSTFGRGAS